jgi:hypothetical protein
MNKKKQAILDRIDRLIERLEQPPPPEEVNHERPPVDRESMLAYYRRLRAAIVSGQRFWRKPHYYSVALGLDSWNFHHPRIVEDARAIAREATAISNMIWDYSPFNQLDFLWDRVRICFSRRRK